MKKTSFILISILLTACGGDIKGDLGLRREGPDEFTVEKRPRLEVPPQFKLRPPAPGEEPRNVVETRDAARKSLINAPIVSGAKTTGENVLLQKAGAASADSKVREVIQKEYDEKEDPSVLEKIRQISDDNMNKTLVDPKKEKLRIEENKKKNKPITEGETPAKSVNDGKSVVEKILN